MTRKRAIIPPVCEARLAAEATACENAPEQSVGSTAGASQKARKNLP